MRGPEVVWLAVLGSGREKVMQNVAIIGAGPAALYAAETLLKAGRKVVMFNRDIKPGGLAEFGIYPNKYKMKVGLRKVFTRILSHPNLTYFGNVAVGEGGVASLEEIGALGFDAVVVAVGAQGTKWLGLPGEDAFGVYHAKDVVYHYNSLPPFSETVYHIGQNVCVVGMGNVSLDIIHWLVCDRKVDNVTMIGRRGPGERAYTNKEMQMVAGALDLEAIREEFASIDEQVRAVDQNPSEYLDELLAQSESELETETPTTLKIRYLRSPAAIQKSDKGEVTGLVCDITTLVMRGDRVSVSSSGTQEIVPCDTVVFAIGDSIEPGIGLPLSDDKKTFAVVPEPWEVHPERDRYMVFDPLKNEPMWGVFVVGWARKASDGLVGKARLDANTGCDEVLAWLDGEFAKSPVSTEDGADIRARELLNSRGAVVVEYADIAALEAHEKKVAEQKGLPEYKFPSSAEMLAIIRGNA